MLTRIPLWGFYEPISSFSHLISAIIFLVFGIRMIWKGRGNLTRSISLMLYIGCCFFLFSMSGVYHLLQKGTTANYVLQILDHAGIFLMISGSFTPFQMILLRGTKRWIPLTVIWILAICGVTFTSIFFDNMPEWLLLSFFIGMGWMSLFTLKYIWNTHRQTAKLIALGGVLYTIGAIFDFVRWPVIYRSIFEAHEMFHLFVTAGALVHFYAIYKISRIPISDTLTVIVKNFPDKVVAHFTSEKALFWAKDDHEIRLKIQEWINANFLKKLPPRKVRLRYFKEDQL
jgi:channel protein (hemolysin III family)